MSKPVLVHVMAVILLLCLSATQGIHGGNGTIGLPGPKGDTVGFILCCNPWALTLWVHRCTTTVRERLCEMVRVFQGNRGEKGAKGEHGTKGSMVT